MRAALRVHVRDEAAVGTEAREEVVVLVGLVVRWNEDFGVAEGVVVKGNERDVAALGLFVAALVRERDRDAIAERRPIGMGRELACRQVYGA